MATQNSQNQQTQYDDSDKDLLLAVYGKDNFVKVYQALEIGKIKFSFVVKSDPKNSIDCYMNVDDFVSDFIDIIDSGELRKLAYQAKQQAQANGSKYASEIWESRAGISNKGEKEQLRKFTIAPGNTQEFTFKATQNGKNILVGFAYRELKLLSYRWHFLEADWNKKMEEKYSLKNMNHEYHLKQNKEQIAQQELEEEELPVAPPARVEHEKPNFGVSSSQQKTELPVTDMPKVNVAERKEEKPAEILSNGKKQYILKVNIAATPMKNGSYAFQGTDANNEIVNVIIRKDRIDQCDPEIERVLSESSIVSSKVSFYGEMIKDRVYVA